MISSKKDKEEWRRRHTGGLWWPSASSRQNEGFQGDLPLSKSDIMGELSKLSVEEEKRTEDKKVLSPN